MEKMQYFLVLFVLLISFVVAEVDQVGGGNKDYTVSLVLMLLGILVILYVIYTFFRRPRGLSES